MCLCIWYICIQYIVGIFDLDDNENQLLKLKKLLDEKYKKGFDETIKCKSMNAIHDLLFETNDHV